MHIHQAVAQLFRDCLLEQPRRNFRDHKQAVLEFREILSIIYAEHAFELRLETSCLDLFGFKVLQTSSKALNSVKLHVLQKNI